MTTQDAASPTSLRGDSRELDHSRPFLGFVGEQLAERRRRECKGGNAEIGKLEARNRSLRIEPLPPVCCVPGAAQRDLGHFARP
jgi:hypothetical protein